jgi:hypothetical protein
VFPQPALVVLVHIVALNMDGSELFLAVLACLVARYNQFRRNFQARKFVLKVREELLAVFSLLFEAFDDKFVDRDAH